MPDSVVRAFLESAGHLYVSENVEETLLRVTTAVTQALDGCDAASVSVVMNNSIITMGATDPLAYQVDQIQYEVQQGPCWDAAHTAQLVYTPDMAHDSRWPSFSARAKSEAGVASLLSCRLAIEARKERTLGALNLYGFGQGVFTEHDQLLAMLFAATTAVVLDAAKEQAHLRDAMESRTVIGQAIGILMAHRGITADEAFDQLRRASQRLNVKLRLVAQRIAESGVNHDGHTA